VSAFDEVAAHVSRSYGLRAEDTWARAFELSLGEVGGGAAPLDVVRDPERRKRLLEELARRITVGETHFYRHAGQLERAASHLFDTATRDGRTVLVWSAGCASGEEPYSVAMLLHRFLGSSLAESVSILGTDLNRDAVEKARNGEYTTWSFRGTPASALAHFEPRAQALRLRTPEVRAAVRFEVSSCQERALSLTSRSQDLVLFRNVAIYFEADAVRSLYAEFARVLRPGAYLALGPVDPRPPDAEFAQVGFFDNAPLYERVTPGSKRPRAPERSVVPRQLPVRDPLLTRVPTEAPPEVRRSKGPVPGAPDLSSALDSARALAEKDPASATAQRIQGLVELELGRAKEATSCFRHALYLDANDLLSRFFYALGLRALGEQRQALLQLQVLESSLGTRDPDTLLDDGETRVSELATSVRFLRGEWR
jgi:chemotaxis protein methyltransferase CheR